MYKGGGFQAKMHYTIFGNSYIIHTRNNENAIPVSRNGVSKLTVYCSLPPFCL